MRKDPADAGADYGVSLSGADFTGFAWGSDVVGWVSFNCSNTGVCGTSNYKVYLGNNRPVVSNLTIFTDYCANDLNSIKFSWSFSDTEDDLASIPQSAYRIDLLRDDAAVCSISENNDDLFINAAEINQTIPILNCPGFIDYKYDYTWSVTVWDSGGLPSVTVNSTPPAFETPDHRYPTADFTYAPASPIPQFQTVSFDPSLSQTFGGFSVASWLWDFGDGTAFLPISNPPNLAGNAEHLYEETGTFTVDLEVTDNSPQAYSCWASERENAKDIDIELNKPTWNEVEPEN